MDLKDKLEALAAAQVPAWGFSYARADYQNLADSVGFIADVLSGYGNDETVMFVDPISRATNKSGALIYSGSFMVLTRSDYDELDYETRYTKYIEPLISILMTSFKNKLSCEFDVDTWKSTEVINTFDWNADGLFITYSLTKP